MSLTITRRQALRLVLTGSVALASTAIALNGPLADTIRAAPLPSTVRLLTVQTGPVPTTADVPEVDVTEPDNAATPSTINVPVPVVVKNFDLAAGLATSVPMSQVLPNNSPLLMSNEALTGVATLADGTIVLAIDPVPGAPNEQTPSRLTLLSTPPIVLNISGLKRDEQLGDVVGTNDGGLVGLVMKRNGTPPVRLVNVDLKTGAINVVNTIHLPQARRFRTLTQASDGTLFTTAVESGGETIVVRMDLNQKKAADVVDLSLNGTAWTNGLDSLVYTAESQPRLLALGAPRYVAPNALYAIDLGSGNMTKLGALPAVRATLAPGAGQASSARG